MLGKIEKVGKGLWLIEGEMPEDNDKYPDVANVIVYRTGDHLYVIDTGVGPRVRDSLSELLLKNSPVRGFTLLNSHGHVDHVCNNDLIRTVSAEAKHHYISEPGMALLDASTYFARHYDLMSEYYDPLSGFRAERLGSPFARLKYRTAPRLRDALSPFTSEEGAYRMIVSLALRRFGPIRASKETVRFFETLPKQELHIGNVRWTGWVLGEDDVWVLEDRGHSPDHMFLYLPEHRFLYTGDSTYDIFNVWPDTDGRVIRHSIGKCALMARAGEVNVLADGHHHRLYQGAQEIEGFLDALLESDRQFREILVRIVVQQEGLTIAEIYKQLEDMSHVPVVRKYLDLEFPHAPGTLQAIVLLALLEMGCEGRGPRRRKRFYLSRETYAEQTLEKGISPQ
jgi:glyoxylase-like metal-dependent hydrolase (beta-lactamase superfamily II)